jgi:4-hydroxybenzoyl-CoA thioesterase
MLMRDDRITLRFMSVPGETSGRGNRIAAGSLLEWIDKAGYACAVGWAGTYAVTAYVGNVHYDRPVQVADLVAVHARIIHTGRTSMHVLVSVETSDVRERHYKPAADCILVFVAIDEHGKTVEVPEWTPHSDSDRALHSYALERIPVRQEIKEAMAKAVYSDAGTTPQSLMRFLVPPSSANWGGNAHGGTVMRWIDEAAYACAASWSSIDAVAVYSGGIHFYRPIHIGDIVEVRARLIHTSARSMHIAIQVHSADPRTPDQLALTTQCMSVFVVPGDDGRATAVESLVLRTDEDRILDAFAISLAEQRQHMLPIPRELAWRD